MLFLTGAFLILVVSLFRHDLQRRREDFITVIGYAVYVSAGGELQSFLAQKLPHTYDTALLRLDARLGFDPMAFATTISHNRWAMIVLVLVYAALPMVIGLAWALEQDFLMRRAVVLAGCLCFVCYALCPAVGPGGFDWMRQTARFVPRNAMPSMHLTWALLIAINAQSLRLRIGLWIYAVLMAFATLALRQHYLVDLIAAIPYTVAVQWIASKYLPLLTRFPFATANS